MAALTQFSDLDQHVIKLSAIGHGAVARDGPWRRGPDHHARTLDSRYRGILDWEADPDHLALVFVIFDLSIGERSFLHHRPQDRANAFIEATIAHEFEDLGDDGRFRVLGHGGIGLLPIADHAQTLEFLGLNIHPFGGELPAFLTEIEGGHLVFILTLCAVLFFDLPFDRQAMTVPARDINSVLAQHLLRAGHHVLQDLIHRVADMDVAIGVWRAIVEHELLTPLSLRLLTLFFVQVNLVPPGEDFRLFLRQASAHGEIRGR